MYICICVFAQALFGKLAMLALLANRRDQAMVAKPDDERFLLQRFQRFKGARARAIFATISPDSRRSRRRWPSSSKVGNTACVHHALPICDGSIFQFSRVQAAVCIDFHRFTLISGGFEVIRARRLGSLWHRVAALGGFVLPL